MKDCYCFLLATYVTVFHSCSYYSTHNLEPEEREKNETKQNKQTRTPWLEVPELPVYTTFISKVFDFVWSKFIWSSFRYNLLFVSKFYLACSRTESLHFGGPFLQTTIFCFLMPWLSCLSLGFKMPQYLWPLSLLSHTLPPRKSLGPIFLTCMSPLLLHYFLPGSREQNLSKLIINSYKAKRRRELESSMTVATLSKNILTHPRK